MTCQTLPFHSLPYLSRLMHLVDPTLPIGGYTHSSGLETFVQQQKVKDKNSLKDYLSHQLCFCWHYTEGPLFITAYEAVINEDMAQFTEADIQYGALKSARETREASHKLGTRLFKIFAAEISQALQSSAFIKTVEQDLTVKKINGYYPTVFALACAAFGIPLPVALHAFYFNSTVGVITNGVKLIPLGQMEGQQILFEITCEIETIVAKTIQQHKKTTDYNGAASPAYDIRCMQHERLYSRLYMS